MQDDAGSELKARLRTDLRTAMKDRNQLQSRVIRSLVAALDNAEAPALPTEQAAPIQHPFASGTAEVERMRLGWPQVREVLLSELQERERAATEFVRLDKRDHAEALREEARLIKQYLT